MKNVDKSAMNSTPWRTERHVKDFCEWNRHLTVSGLKPVDLFG